MAVWYLVPSRGRPWNVERLVRHCVLTCQGDTRLHFAFDQDDEHLQANISATGGHRYTVGPRDTLTGWTNALASKHMDAEALGSIGDDMVPVTDGWDARLLAALPEGGGFCYPNDRRRSDIPEAVLISRVIVEALGWMCWPGTTHWYTDNIWRDLGAGAGCLAYCPQVIVEHRHPNMPGGDRPDATYHDAAQRFDADLGAYQKWRLRDMRRDVAAVRRVREAALNPV